jgi:hypothetical protein
LQTVCQVYFYASMREYRTEVIFKRYLQCLSVFEYEPYTQESKIITLPNITGNIDYEAGVINLDIRTGSVYITVNAPAPFKTNGRNLTRPNRPVRYNTFTQRILWEVVLAGFQEEVLARTGKFVSGFQDQAEGPRIYADHFRQCHRMNLYRRPRSVNLLCVRTK